jgi:predicted MFS family arabinose efflux permease
VQLAAITFGRLVVNTSLRMMYPFLPAIARGLDVSLGSVAQLVALRSFAGFLSPLFSPLSERFGRRLVLVLSMAAFSLGSLVVFFWPAYWPLGVTLVVTGVAKVVYDPAMQSYLGDMVAYERRGKAIAITEFSWAGALLVGAPLIGFVIQRQGWHAPFFWLAVTGLGATLLLWRLLPPARVHATRAADLRSVLRVMRGHSVIWAVAVYVLLAMIAQEMLLIVYGDWMEQSYGLALTNLGLASAVIGGAEVFGELTAGWSVDRFGKRRVVIALGLVLAGVYVAMPYTSINLTAALVTLFIFFYLFEATFVGSMPLMTEVVPTARSVVLSVAFASAGLGRMIGALLGPAVWQQFGLQGNTMVGGMLMLLSILVLARWVHEAQGEPDMAAMTTGDGAPQ